MSLRSNLTSVFIYTLIFAVFSLILLKGLFHKAETAIYDLHMSSSGHLANPDIVIVSIDDNTISKLGNYPTRDLFNKVIADIASASPKSITLTNPMAERENDMGEQYLLSLNKKIIDLKTQLDNSTSTEEKIAINNLISDFELALTTLETDEKLAKTISSNMNIILPLVLGQKNTSQSNASSNQNELEPWLKKINHLTFSNPPKINKQSEFFSLQPPNDLLRESTDFFGVINKTLDHDNVVRNEHLIWEYNGYYLPSISLATYLIANANESTLDFSVKHTSKGLSLFNDSLNINSQGKISTRYYSGTLKDNFTHYSFYDVFVESIPTQNFTNKVILIGNTALNYTNKNNFPNGQQKSSLESIAHTVSSLLNQDWITHTDKHRLIEVLFYFLAFCYLCFVIPKINTFFAWFLTLVFCFLLVLIEFGGLEQSIWVHLLTTAIYVFVGHLLLTILRVRSKEQLALEQKNSNQLENYQLARELHTQGSLSLAFEKYIQCLPNPEVLNPFYNLGLDFERKREYQKAREVYAKISEIDENYQDITQRQEKLTRIEAMRTQNFDPNATDLLEIPDDLSIEKPKLGRYIIEQELGRGAMSTVYLGIDPSIDREVAIKVQHFTGDDIENVNKMRERFLAEARTAGKLNHPDIVTIYDVGEEKDLAYIAMEKLNGDSLDLYVNDIRLSDEKLLTIAIRVSRALAYAHQNKVIHRDVKPSNVVYDDQADTLHLTDFGIAHIQDAGLTQTGTVVGTPSYMSPEQITGKSVSPASDLFSLGVTLYQLYTGRLPFEADTLASLLFKITSENPIPIELLQPGIQPEIKAIIDKLLKKEPSERYKDAESLAKDLEDCKNSLKNSV